MAQAVTNVTALSSAAKTRLEERGRTASEIEVLASDTRRLDPALGTLMTRLADAVRRGDRDEIHGYADAVDPRAIAEVLTSKRSEERRVGKESRTRWWAVRCRGGCENIDC